MKKISLLVALVMILMCFSGCKERSKPLSESVSKGRAIYNINMEEYVKLGEYKNLTIDTSSESYKELYNKELTDDVSRNNLYKASQTTGNVSLGDVANIDYTGKKDGVAFEGGTDTGYDLTIGSGTFIPGFEEGLVGVAVGSTVDLDVTFPEDYGSEDLAGKAVVFTVKVNSIKPAKTPEEYYADLKFASVEEYLADVTSRAKKAYAYEYLIEEIAKSSEVKDCPDEDAEILCDAIIAMYEAQYQAAYGVDFETVLSASNMTLKDFKADLKKNYVADLAPLQMVTYAILDKEGIKITAESVKAQNTGSDILNEITAVEDAVAEFIASNSVEK